MDTTRVSEDLKTLQDIVERGDRLMYQADNFADRTEFDEARRAYQRTAERMLRLVAYFQASAARGDAVMEVVEEVAETFEPEWDVERDKAGSPV